MLMQMQSVYPSATFMPCPFNLTFWESENYIGRMKKVSNSVMEIKAVSNTSYTQAQTNDEFVHPLPHKTLN